MGDNALGDNKKTGVNVGDVGGSISKSVFAGRDVSNVQIGDIINQAPVEWPISSGVPPKPNLIVGRDELVQKLIDKLLSGKSPALSVVGMAGVGKTTLAVALAHHPEVETHFKDGVLWAGLGPQSDVMSVLARWAGALKIDVAKLIQPEQRVQAIQAVIAKHHLLIVIDDAWDLASAKQLRRCGGDNCRYLLTSRDQTIAREFAGAPQAETIPVLEPTPANQMLRWLAADAYEKDPKAAQTLVEAVGRLPLALELLGGYLDHSRHRRIASRRQQALDTLTNPSQRLKLATQRLGAQPDDPEVTLQATIALSLEDLPEETVATYHALGAFAPSPERFTLEAALAVTKGEEDLLFDLADRNLLVMDEEERLALHQVLADVARPQTRQDAVIAHRDHYLERVNQDRENWQRIDDLYGQISWAWIRQRHSKSEDKKPFEFVWSLRIYQERRGLWQDKLAWATYCLQLAKDHNWDEEAASMLVNIGFVYSALGDKQQALAFFNQALPLRIQVGDKRGEATTLNNIGRVYDDLGDKQQALHFYNQALPLQQQVGDKRGEATTLSNIGAVYDALGDKQQALHFYNQALPLQQQVGDKAGEATTLSNIGAVYDALGDKQQALAFYNQALPIDQQVGDKAGEATTLNNIGAVYDDLGDKQQALAFFNQALPLQQQVGDKAGEATTLSNIGAVYDALGDKQQALHFFNQALPLQQQVGDKRGEATTLSNIGAVYDALGDKQQALAFYNQALPLRIQVGDKGGEATTLSNIGAVYDALGDKQQALAFFNQALPLRIQVGDKRGEATTLSNIGRVYSALGDKQQALAFYNQALPLRIQVGDKRGEATTLSNIGAVYDDLGDKQQALAFFNQALPLRRQVGDRFGEIITRWWLGILYRAEGQLEAAVAQLETATEIATAVQSPHLAAVEQALIQTRTLLTNENP